MAVVELITVVGSWRKKCGMVVMEVVKDEW